MMRARHRRRELVPDADDPLQSSRSRVMLAKSRAVVGTMKVWVLALAASVTATSMSVSAQYDATWTQYDEADAKLNAAYAALRAVGSPAENRHVLAAQRAWLTARNQRCGRETRNACATALEVKRTAQLEHQLSATNLSSTNFSNSGPVPAWTKKYPISVRPLLIRESRLDEACHSSAQDPDGPVCKARDRSVDQLQVNGWCWGPDSASSESERYWMRCGRDAKPIF